MRDYRKMARDVMRSWGCAVDEQWVEEYAAQLRELIEGKDA